MRDEQPQDARLCAACSDPAPHALLDAAAVGDVAAVLALLQSGASVDSATTSGGVTALMKAAHGGHASVVECLLMRDANASARESANGNTALILAAAVGATSCAKLLLRKSSSPVEQDAEGVHLQSKICAPNFQNSH